MAEKMFKTLIFVETSQLNYLLFFASVAKFIQFQTINTTQISDFENYSIYFFYHTAWNKRSFTKLGDTVIIKNIDWKVFFIMITLGKMLTNFIFICINLILLFR